MRVLGIDPSSSCTGIALVDGGKLVSTGVWRPEKKSALATDRLSQYFGWIQNKLELAEVELVALEIIAFNRSHTTTRVLSRYEAASILAAKLFGADVAECRVSEARKMVLGNGGLSKVEAYEQAKRLAPNHKWAAYTSGGNDQTDAYICALAAPALKVT